MKITFVGLSCFLFENEVGDTLIIDPFYDSPEFFLGLHFPKDLQADVFLVSHPDEDHSYLRHNMIKARRSPYIKDPESEITMFPKLNIRGTMVKEYNGDINIAWQFTIDTIRFLHLADNAHLLSTAQLNEIGEVDVIFLPMPKGENTEYIENIKLLNPRLVICSHLIPPIKSLENNTRDEILQGIEPLFSDKNISNPAYNAESMNTLVDMYHRSFALAKHFPFQKIEDWSYEITKNTLPKDVKVLLFTKCLGTSSLNL